jgi:putative ABC transport system substrate-binding protein
VKRRQFITLLGGAATIWSFAARAQQSTLPVIGFLRPTTPEDSEQLLRAWREGLKEAGYVEGQNVVVEYRWAKNQFNQLPALATDLGSRRVSVIVAAGNAAAQAAKGATTSIPIVFAIGDDPIAAHLVTSLNRPGGNVTGITFVTTDVVTKKIQLLSELLGKSMTLAFLTNPDNAQNDRELRESQTAAQPLREQILALSANTDAQIEAAFARMVEQRVGGLLVAGDAFFFSKRKRFVALAARYGIPTAYVWRDAVRAGGLMSYGPSLPDTYRQAGIYAGRILKGEKPGDLPVMQASKFEFVINLTTAKALGLTIPASMLSLADELVE